MPFSEKLKSWLSSRQASILIIFIATAGRVLQKLHFSRATGDKIHQVQATKNLLEGHGISIYETFLNNLSSPQYTPLVKWPPGYSLLLAPFYAVSGDHFLWGTILLDILISILFVWIARKTIQLFDLPAWMVNLYTLVAGFVMMEFCMFPSSDFISLLFYEIAFYLTLRFIRSTNKSYAAAIGIGIFLFAAGFMRYMFIPLVFVIPLYLMLSGWINRDKKFVSRGFIMLVVICLLTTFLLGFQQVYGGSATYYLPSQRGFYPEHLLRMHPFLFASVFNVQFATTMFSNATHIPYLTVRAYTDWVHFLVFILVLVLFLQWFFRKRLSRASFLDHFIYIGIFSSLASIGLLGLLSITHAVVLRFPKSDWSFIDEGRFYSIPIVFLQQLIFIAWYRKRNSPNKWVRNILLVSMIILFANMLQGLNYTLKSALGGKHTFFIQKDQFEEMATAKVLLHETIAANPGKSVVMYSTEPMFNNYGALWENIPGIYADKDLNIYQMGTEKENQVDEQLNSFQFSTEKETLLFIAVSQMYSYKAHTLLSHPGIKLIGKKNTFSFYTLEVDP